MNEEKREPLEPTLTQFIESNQKLISTLAIFATLSAFANNLPDKDTGRILSFFLFTLALLVGIEILMSFPFVHRGRLYWFKEIFGASMFMFGYAWVHTYYPYLASFLFMTVTLAVIVLIFGLFSKAIRWTVPKISWLKNRSQETREVRIPLYGAMLLMTLTAVILWQFKLI